MRQLTNACLPLVPVTAVAVVGAWAMFDWIVDDAAISYVYGRNVAHGFGLVAQPSRSPVEGYSNPIWVALLSVMSLVPLAPHLALKVTGWLCQAAFLAAAGFSTSSRGIPARVWGPFLGVLALEPPLLIWSNSGLECPLLLLATLLLADGLARTIDSFRRRDATVAGVAAAACSLTRPEAVLFATGGFLLLLCIGKRSFAVRRQALIAYVAAAATPYVLYTVFRLSYFHDWLPNTFYAKGGLTQPRILDAVTFSPHAIAKVLELGEALGGYYGATAVLASLGVLMASGLRRQGLSSSSIAHLALAAAAATAYVVLPGDWMGEYRYAAPAVLLLSMSAFHLAADLWLALGRVRPAISASTAALLAAATATACVLWTARIYEFSAQPPMPLSEVLNRARRFDASARVLGIDRPSILTQDVGGFLLDDKLEVFDIGMLTDRRIAHAIGDWRTPPDREALREYIFEEVKPDFISVAAYHAWASRLDEDARLSRDYIPINAKRDDWVLRRYGTVIESGEYLRRSLLRSDVAMDRVRTLLSSP